MLHAAVLSELIIMIDDSSICLWVEKSADSNGLKPHGPPIPGVIINQDVGRVDWV